MSRTSASTPKKPTKSKANTSKVKQPTQDTPGGILTKTSTRIQQFLARRPHRSFRLTRRRDYTRSLKLPGYWALSVEALYLLRQQRRTFLLLIAIYAIASALFVGIASQATFTELSDTLSQAGGDMFAGAWGEVGKASLLFAGSVSSGVYAAGDAGVQQVFAVLFFSLLWLTTIWLLRAGMSGRAVKLRDGLYNAGAPLIPTVILVVFLILQFVPTAVAAIIYSAASSSGLLSGGIEAMIFTIAAALLVVLTVYLVSTTFFSLVVVTLPGMYPWQALRIAGDLVVSRRVRLLLRLVWMIVTVGLVWLVVMIPTVLFATWLVAYAPSLEWVPVMPVVLLILSSASAVYVTAYIYLLYRKVVDDDAQPA